MKDIIIPEQLSSAITIGEINGSTNGIIISYIGKDATGYITYSVNDEVWVWHPSIDSDTDAMDGIDDKSLLNLIKEVIDSGHADKFKLMEFDNDN